MAEATTDIFEERRLFCIERLDQLRERVAEIPELNRPDLGLCIYATGLLARQYKQLAPDQLTELVRMPPLDRLRESAYAIPGGESSLRQLLDDYSWFLAVTDRPKEDLLQWSTDRSTRDEAFERARTFGREMYDLLFKISQDGDLLRYMVI